jgi:phosphohistidine phosphatase
MRRLILFRHAKAQARSATGEDIDRPLDQDGRADCAIMGRVLAGEGLTPDLVLVSSSRRTRETWDCLAAFFPRARVRFSDELYNASVEDILGEIDAAAGEAATLMVVAHNPGLHELAVELTCDAGASAGEIDRISARFPTATAAAFQMDAGGRPSPDGLFHARDFGGGEE